MPVAEFSSTLSQDIWEQKYRFVRDGKAVDRTAGDTIVRVARAAAGAERGGKKAKERWAQTFGAAMADFAFLPAGRILAGAGTGRTVTMFNCFVMGRIGDDLSAIFDAVKDGALTMQAGGGIGCDFSTLRPRGAAVRGVGACASGPVSFMDVWDAMCATIQSAGQRRGAMMATLRCDHPDIEEFIAAKAERGRLRNFNLSVLVTDDFIAAVRGGRPFDLVFEGHVHRTLDARSLWERITRSNYAYAEPGVIFIDRVNGLNNLAYCETIHATNPCGEQPLPPYGACLLGSLNLTRFVDDPFTPAARIDTARLTATVRTVVRMLDNIIDVSHYPLPVQAREAKAKRRIGLGVTGLADALIFLGLRYGSAQARKEAGTWMALIQNHAYLASAELAAEKGAFPLFDAGAFLARPNVARLDEEVRAAITRHGIRNGCLTSVAPAGTISLLAGNVSSGVEPVFEFIYRRRIRQADGPDREEVVEDYAHALFRKIHGGTAPSGDAWVTAGELAPAEHMAMQAALQTHVDSAISKTINCPADIAPEAFETLYLDAYDRGLKGCTTFRPNPVTGVVLSPLASTPGSDSGEAAPRSEPASAAVPPPERQLPATARIKAVKEGLGGNGIVYMSEPLARDAALPGQTYKLKWPQSGHAFYITINDIVRDGRTRPFEIFINTKDLTHYAWTVALTRMISAVFRRGGDVSFVAEELKAIFDPQGGHWIGGAYVPSLLAAIGGIIENHLAGLEPVADRSARALHSGDGGQAGKGDNPDRDPARRRGSEGLAGSIGVAGGAGGFTTDDGRPVRFCPQCSSRRYRMDGGCRVCLECGQASCG